ncbi:MAG: hypothetical protein WB870_06635 [Gallionellaceae bacterium]
MHTTLKQLRAADACVPRYTHLRQALGPKYGDNKPITMTQILDLNGVDDCLWAIVNTHQKPDKLLRLFACLAEEVMPIYLREMLEAEK